MVTKASGITTTVNLLRVRLKVKSSPFHQQTFHESYECQVTTGPLKFYCLLAASVKFRRFFTLLTYLNVFETSILQSSIKLRRSRTPSET